MSSNPLPEFTALQTQVAELTASLEAARKELTIEASLERVRVVAMTMDLPSALIEVCKTLLTELQTLGFTQIRNTQIAIANDAKASYMNYESYPNDKNFVGEVAYSSHPFIAALAANMRTNKDAFFHESISGEALHDWRSYIKRLSNQPTPKLDAAQALHYYYYSIGAGGLGFCTYEPLGDQDMHVLRRFRNVFELAYRRYTDIEQAFAQAREAQIEVALERVRSKAMAMQQSEDLAHAVAVVFEELDKLHSGMLRCGIAILDPEKPRGDIWITVKSEEGDKIHVSGDEPLDIHPLLKGAHEAWLKQEDFSYILEGDDLFTYYQSLDPTNLQLPILATFHPDEKDQQHYYFNTPFQHGSLFAFMKTAITAEIKQVMKRFANVFDLTYKRFLDLQKAEAQAREAQIQTGLERVRSRTMAMQTCEELSETAAVFFKELIRLGISPNRLYIAIIDSDDPNEVWFYITNEEGGQDCSMYVADIRHNAVFKTMYDAWADKERSLVFELRGDALVTYFDYLRNTLHMPVNVHSTATRRVHNLAFFSQGFVGIASLEDQPEETSRLLERFADVFNLTYTRFSDLKVAEGLAEQAELDLVKLKEEKLRTEHALTELKAAQAQLIQAEKMASLGELTAGIAHEIQNPLNFVNNFSEVNTELIEELKEELATGNWQQAAVIADNIKENEAKIVIHGKRADGIVKGMLQHSRTSNGQKEPTDINALADEYLRLAYYGMRAKEKSFNAILKTDFDTSIGLINVVPQDIGRVILNLITNAFHAVTTPQPPKEGVLFQPTLTVKTKLLPPTGGKGVEGKGALVEISITDNGSGIPSQILDKIFQPFFTTKPTGSGTGLGLSISYDIVKAHGGELNVETKEGEGSTFILYLPHQ